MYTAVMPLIDVASAVSASNSGKMAKVVLTVGIVHDKNGNATMKLLKPEEKKNQEQLELTVAPFSASEDILNSQVINNVNEDAPDNDIIQLLQGLHIMEKNTTSVSMINSSYDPHEFKHSGFVNNGASCFMNSALQCLVHMPLFCERLVKLGPRNEQMKELIMFIENNQPLVNPMHLLKVFFVLKYFFL